MDQPPKPPPSPCKYADGCAVKLGDLVEYGGQPGTVVVHGLSQGFATGFPRDVWETEIGTGFLICFANGALLSLDAPDEDLVLVGRGVGV